MNPKTKKDLKKRGARTQKSITIHITQKLEDLSSETHEQMPAADRVAANKQDAGIDFSTYASTDSIAETKETKTDVSQIGDRREKETDGGASEKTLSKSLGDARPFPAAASSIGTHPGRVKDLAIKLAKLINMDGAAKEEFIEQPSTLGCSTEKVEEEVLTKPSTMEKGYLKKLENICKKMVSGKNTANGDYMYVYSSSFELRNSCQYVCQSKVREIITRTFEKTQERVADATRKITIPERSIKFEDALKMFEK